MKKIIILFVSLGVITTAAITTFNESKKNSGDFPSAGFITTQDVSVPVATEKTKMPVLPAASNRSSDNGSSQGISLALTSGGKTTSAISRNNSAGLPQINSGASYAVGANMEKTKKKSSTGGTAGGYSGGMSAAGKKSENSSTGGSVGITYLANNNLKQDALNSIGNILQDDPYYILQDETSGLPVLLQPANTPINEGWLFLIILSFCFIFFKRRLI